MDDLEKMGETLLSGKNGPALRALADSPEAKSLSQKLDAAAAERALRSGDPAQMRSLLEKLLSTSEGRSLAEKLSGMGGRP